MPVLLIKSAIVFQLSLFSGDLGLCLNLHLGAFSTFGFYLFFLSHLFLLTLTNQSLVSRVRYISNSRFRAVGVIWLFFLFFFWNLLVSCSFCPFWMQRRMYFVLISLQVWVNKRTVMFTILTLCESHEMFCYPQIIKVLVISSWQFVSFAPSHYYPDLVWVCCPVVVGSRLKCSIHFWKSKLTDTRLTQNLGAEYNGFDS